MKRSDPLTEKSDHMILESIAFWNPVTPLSSKQIMPITQQEWQSLSEEARLTAFNKAKLVSGFHIKNDIGYIVRPLLPMHGYWNSFKPLIQNKFPKGEEQEFHEMAPTYENYKYLLNWLNARCFRCGSAELHWEQNDNSIITYCYKCGNVRFFINVK